MGTECRLVALEEIFDRQKVGRKYGDSEAFIEPGMMWFLPTIFDHQDPDLEQYLPQLIARADNQRNRQTSLSSFYLREWSRLRDPLCIMLPCNDLFYPDSAPAGTDGWRVFGPIPSLTIDRQAVVRSHRYAIQNGIIR